MGFGADIDLMDFGQDFVETSIKFQRSTKKQQLQIHQETRQKTRILEN